MAFMSRRDIRQSLRRLRQPIISVVGKRPPFSISSRGGTAETRLRIGPQPSLRDGGDNGSRLVPPLKRWAIVSRLWRDYAARLFLWEKRNPGLLSLNPRSGVW